MVCPNLTTEDGDNVCGRERDDHGLSVQILRKRAGDCSLRNTDNSNPFRPLQARRLRQSRRKRQRQGIQEECKAVVSEKEKRKKGVERGPLDQDKLSHICLFSSLLLSCLVLTTMTSQTALIVVPILLLTFAKKPLSGRALSREKA